VVREGKDVKGCFPDGGRDLLFDACAKNSRAVTLAAFGPRGQPSQRKGCDSERKADRRTAPGQSTYALSPG
jgi:hypothetical protein